MGPKLHTLAGCQLHQLELTKPTARQHYPTIWVEVGNKFLNKLLLLRRG